MIQSNELRHAFYLFCDIRGFSMWVQTNQLETTNLLDIFYDAGFNSFGGRKEQKYHKRVAKLLGDGFLIVYEYEKDNRKAFKETLYKLIDAITIFRIDFDNRLEKSTIHGKTKIKCSYGLSYGPCVKILIPGYPLDYVGDRINFASRLVDVASPNEIVFEYGLWDEIENNDVLNKREEERELKKIGNVRVGIFDADI